MQRLSRPRDKWRDVVFGGIALLVILADQLSKWWIRGHVAANSVLFDAGFFQIARVQNTGAVFGIFKAYTPVLIILSFVSMAVILLFAFILKNRWSSLDSRLVRAAIGLVMGGTIGNQIDRLRLGSVTDFIDFKIWPAFNVADSAVNIGIIIFIFSIIFLAKPAKHEA
jgi:signal peptidase II